VSTVAAPVKPTRMTGEEVLAEVEWLLDAGVHPLLIAQELHRTLSALEVMARRHGNDRIRTVYQKCVSEARRGRY
jgi:hypothetical protein